MSRDKAFAAEQLYGQIAYYGKVLGQTEREIRAVMREAAMNGGGEERLQFLRERADDVRTEIAARRRKLVRLGFKEER